MGLWVMGRAGLDYSYNLVMQLGLSISETLSADQQPARHIVSCFVCIQRILVFSHRIFSCAGEM